MVDRSIYLDALSNVQAYNGTLAYAENAQLLAELPSREFAKIIRDWFDGIHSGGSVNPDLVRDAGMLCHLVENAEVEVVSWASDKSDDLSYQIAARFLTGFWISTRHAGGEHVEFVLALADKIASREQLSYAFILQALLAVADPVADVQLDEPLRARVRASLLQHLSFLKKRNLHPKVAESLQVLNDVEARALFLVFDKAKDMDLSALHGKSASELSDALLRWLDLWSPSQFFDWDRVWYAGRYLGSAVRMGVDGEVCRWLRGSTTAEKSLAASAFLHGYWASGAGVSPACVDTLKIAASRLPAQSDSQKAISLALSAAASAPK